MTRADIGGGGSTYIVPKKRSSKNFEVSKKAGVDCKNFKSYIWHPKMGKFEHLLKNPGSGVQILPCGHPGGGG